MAEKNAREILIEKFLTGYKITREDWIKLLMAYALVEEAAKNTTPATVEEVLGGSDNEKFITSFLLDYFWKTKILGTNPDSNLNDFSAVATKLKGLIADSSTNTTNTWSSQKIMETITASEAGMLTCKGQVADIAALNAIASPKVGDIYNVLGDGNGANFTWNGTAWDELGMHIVLDNAPIQNSKNPVSSGGVFEELAKKVDKTEDIPKIILKRSSIQYFPNQGETKLLFDKIVFKIGNIDINSNGIQINTSGIYKIIIGFNMDTHLITYPWGSSTEFPLILYRNTLSFKSYRQPTYYINNSGSITNVYSNLMPFHVVDILQLNEGDRIEIYSKNLQTVSNTLSGYDIEKTFLYAEKIS